MATVTSMTSEAILAALDGKADLAGGVLPDAQAPAIAMKKDTWVVDLNDHGGVGDGTTSNDAAWASALSAINPTWGGKIVVRAGSYLISGSTAITLAVQGTTIEGVGPESSRIVIGSGFTGAQAIQINANNCRIRSLSILGSNSTTTSNPVCGGIQVNGARRAKVEDCHFWYINGWGFEAVASATGGSNNPDGTMVTRCVFRLNAGGIHFKGASVSGYAVDSFISDVQMVQTGVTTGASANLDGLLIEDSWDVLVSNLFVWTSTGTGASLHVKGNCAAIFVKNLDGLGPNTGNCVLIEDSANGSPQNVQLTGGVIQQGLIGLRITGGAYKVAVRQFRFINNQTHAMSVEGTGVPISGRELTFETSGASASGTNYDINWSGTSTGYLTDCRFETPIVSTGTAGVQKTINVASAGQNVRCTNMSFNGASSSSSNWYTNTPSSVFEYTSGTFDFFTSVKFSVGMTAQGNFSAQPSSYGNTVFSANTGGSASFDSLRITSDGVMAAGTGTSARDSSWGRLGTALFGSSDSDIVANLAGKGFKIKEGSNARMGTATLVAGAVTISNNSITANTRIVVACKTPGGTPGALFVNTVTVGTSFVVHSTSSTDTSVIGYVLFEAA
jgi:hypothetical protein